MITELSIVIPTYNQACLSLVEELHKQASQATGLTFEVIVADDGSNDEKVIVTNRRINAFPHCRYIERRVNMGRAAIRNYLAQESRYSWLLFIDSRMRIANEDYLRTYLSQDSNDVTYGSYMIVEDPSFISNLRYMYERHYLLRHPAHVRQEHPYHDFHTSNFLVRRDVLTNCPFDERFKQYGYEDVLYGRQLEEHGYGLMHLDNPVVFEHFESNERFVEKTEEALRTLYTYRDDMSNYSRMIVVTNKLRHCGMLWLVRLAYRLFGKRWRRKCVGEHPTLKAFNYYRLGYFTDLLGNKKA